MFFAHHTAEPEIVDCLVGIYYITWLELANQSNSSLASDTWREISVSAGEKEGVNEERSHKSGEYGREDS